MLGTGYIADYHAKALRATPGLELAAVCDRSISRAKTFAEANGVAAVYGSLEDMLANAQLDAVHVLTPPEAHLEPTVHLINAGVDVLLEKPMSITAEDCSRLVDLAKQRGVRLGVAHNFLFSEPYEQLRNDIAQNQLGPIDHIGITWHKPLGQLAAGPFDLWMFRDPSNILFEIGPHPFCQLLDLVGQPDAIDVVASNELQLPSGVTFFRRWHVYARCGRTAVDVNLSFVSGFSEHWIHVRGATASATVDYERNTYLRHQHVPSDLDFDRYEMLRRESNLLVSQARRTLFGYVASKVRPSTRGNPYGYSIANAAGVFHATNGCEVDSRISPEMGRDVIRLCERVRDSGAAHQPREKVVPPVQIARPSTPPRILVLGATGFIGKELVRQLIEREKSVRVLVRSSGKVDADLVARGVHVVQGDCSVARDLDVALEGIDCVIHLARSNVKTWSDYNKHEIEMTRLVAERSLARGVRRFIYSGTIDSYYAGPGAGVITETTELDPKIEQRNFYARAKAVSEQMLGSMHRDAGLPLIIFRPGIVVGRGGSPLHWGIGMWQHDVICRLWGDGDNKLPLVLVEDVARGIIAGVESPRDLLGQSFNLVGDPLLSGNEYLDELERAAKLKISRHRTPIATFYAEAMGKWVVKVAVKHPDRVMPSYRDWASRTQMAVFDCSRSKTILEWQPERDRETFVQRGIVEPALAWFA